jgi:hypothetical protein
MPCQGSSTLTSAGLITFQGAFKASATNKTLICELRLEFGLKGKGWGKMSEIAK